MSFLKQMQAAKQASYALGSLSTEQKNIALKVVADALQQHHQRIVDANRLDISAAEKAGLGPMIDRLMLNKERIDTIANDINTVISLPDPVGQLLEKHEMPNGLGISKVRVPMGVIGMIYESRPNVTVDAAILSLKSGNAVVLKGGKEALHTNRILTEVMQEALLSTAIPAEALQFLDTAERAASLELLQARGIVDLVIPRGGKGLIDFVIENAKVPVIETGASVVHTYVDESADLSNALRIIANEKTRRVSVCNALDTLLVHQKIAGKLLPALATEFIRLYEEQGIPLVRIHADETVLALMAKLTPECQIDLSKNDFSTEWLDYDLNIRIVQDLDEAIKHIRQYSLGHSESICTGKQESADRFIREVDAACVYVNSSTAFSDGAQFGLGAEIGISTQKLHARGPFALEGLCTYKWIVRGNGQVRP